MKDETKRFTPYAQKYAKYRPHYPPTIIEFLKRHLYLNHKSTVADIGSGTGISSKLFLPHVRKLCGVEPNPDMRQLAEKELLPTFPNFVSVNGRAENTTLANDSIDFVVIAQAFHWIDIETAYQEMRRIMKRNRYVILLWNKRNPLHSPFTREYERFLKEFSKSNPTAYNVEETDLQTFFKDGYQEVAFPNEQYLDWESLEGYYLSASYSLDANHPRIDLALSTLKELFQTYQTDGKVKMTYITEMYLGIFNKYMPEIPFYKKFFYHALRPIALFFYILVKLNIRFWAMFTKKSSKDDAT